MDRFKSTRIAGLAGIIGNIFLLIIKGIIGFATNSQAMIADSINSASDIFASLMTFIGNKISSVPEDYDHNFGHGKAEYVFSLFISISMILISLKLLYDSVFSLFNNKEFIFSWFLVIVCIITIVIKLFLYLYTKKLYKKYNNILLKASYKDHKNDCIVTLFTLTSILFALKQIYWVDCIVGVGISIWICFTGFKIFIESYNVLMDVSIDKNTKDIILDLLHINNQVKEVNNIDSIPIGYKYLIVISISVDGKMSTFDSHTLADNLERDIEALERIEKVVIHVNPV